MISNHALPLGQLLTLSALAAALLVAATPAVAQKKTVGPAPTSKKMAWWRDARFGLFIHWGPVSQTGQEISWSRANSNPHCPNNGNIPVDVYDNLYKTFDPTEFDASAWVDVASRAGMKYMVLTAKHCDGFLLWPSKASDYNISSTPYQKDICGALADAAHKKKMKIGWYYSPMDWRDPDFRTEKNPAFIDRMHTELHELLANYGKIDMLWFDWDCGDPMYDQANTYKLVTKLQAKMLINNRLDLGPHDSNRQLLSQYASYYTPEQELGAYDDTTPWETCMTLGEQWAWKPNERLKTVSTVVRALASCAGGDGNLLLNVGPMPDGRIEPRQAEILNGVGEWLKTHGDAIYGTRGGPYKPSPNYTSTRKGNTVYVHVLNWTGDAIQLPALPARVLKAEVLGDGTAAFEQSANALTLTVPSAAHDPNDTVIALTLDISAMRLAPIDSVYAAGAASASNVYQNSSEYGPDKAFDGNDATRWATDGGTKEAWLQRDYKTPTQIDGVNIKEAYANRVASFQIEYRSSDDGPWISIFQGKQIGADFHCRFDPVTAKSVRLKVLDASDGPTITDVNIQTVE
ncbi:MAG: alpha-L-fucosidase [Capsulimonas sp.]|uniref:alpha-L-fucosidase n=1 Tax=Capsulimonas sp. TaxID=2494211 RepID=UPI0032641ECE